MDERLNSRILWAAALKKHPAVEDDTVEMTHLRRPIRSAGAEQPDCH